MPIGVYVRKLKPPAERYRAKVEKRGPDDCWPWKTRPTRRRKRAGQLHASFQIRRGIVVQATHFGWELAGNGPVPEGLCVCHHCDNPPCQNPKHWFLGTRADNVADMCAKGRDRHPRGDQNGSRTHPERRPRGDTHWRRRQTFQR